MISRCMELMELVLNKHCAFSNFNVDSTADTLLSLIYIPFILVFYEIVRPFCYNIFYTLEFFNAFD